MIVLGNGDVERFEKHREEFFAMIGHCVTIYQGLEERLPSIFSVSTGVKAQISSEIFKSLRGIESKLAIISASIMEKDKSIQNEWDGLCRRIKAASDARSEIAHGGLVSNGGVVEVRMSEDGRAAEHFRRQDPRMELRKKTKIGEKIWTIDLMYDQYRNVEKIQSDVHDFVFKLGGYI